MDPFLLSTVVNAAAGSGNVLSQILTNRANRRFSERMYERQRADALEFWRMENEYNSPAAQMQRFREAGLNPHLIYDKGTSGLAGSLPVPSAPSAMSQAPDFSAFSRSADSIMRYYDIQQMEMQRDLMREQIELARQEALLKIAQEGAQLLQTDILRYDYEMKQTLRDVVIESAKENLRSQQISNDLAIQRDEREAMMTASSLQEAAERIMSMRVERLRTEAETLRTKTDVVRVRKEIERLEKAIRSTELDNVLKDLEITLRRKGLSSSDPALVRIMSRLVDDIQNGTASSHWSTIYEIVKKFFDWFGN